MFKIVLGTHNKDKEKELRELLTNFPFQFISPNHVPTVEETASTFLENALLKARHATHYTNLPALAEDSGLIVPALGGKPGVHSARYAGPGASAVERINKLLGELNQLKNPDRSAFFYSVVVFLKNSGDTTPLIGQGIWHGKILDHRQGTEGFGYDPIFWVPTHHCSAAQLPLSIKNEISHRAHAIKTFLHIFSNSLLYRTEIFQTGTNAKNLR